MTGDTALNAYRRLMLDHVHTYETWDTDLGKIEVCECGQARAPRTPDNHETLTPEP